MAVIKSVICTILALSSLITATPISITDVEERSLFQVESDHVKRDLFNVDDIKDAGRKKFLQDALKEAVDIAGIALKFMDSPDYADYLGKWFGTGQGVKDDVKGVLTNFVGANHNGEGSVVLKDVKVWQDDYYKPKGLKGNWCDEKNKEGKTGTAYYTPNTKAHAGPGMHYCDKFFQRKSKLDYLADNCKSISNHIDTDTTTRMYRGANVLHEMMHYEKVGKQQTGQYINDWAYGAFSSYTYKDKSDASDPYRRAALNADTYVFYTMHIWLSVNCGKSFSYPRSEQDD